MRQCTLTAISATGNKGDENRFPTFIGNYHKGLPHNGFCEVVPAAYQTLLDAADKKAPFASIALESGRKLTNPQAGLATDLEGPDPDKLAMLSPPTVDSAEAAAEAVELYWMSHSPTSMRSHARIADRTGLRCRHASTAIVSTPPHTRAEGERRRRW